MDPITMIVTALVTGAAAALKPVAEQAIKDGYASLKVLIQRKYQDVSIATLEKNPVSKERQKIVEEDLKAADAGKDEEVLRQAQDLLKAVEKQAPEVAGAVGVNLQEIKKATGIKIEDIIASGTGVNLEKIDEVTNLDIKQVRAGQTGDSSKK